jgi:hypothetical protein
MTDMKDKVTLITGSSSGIGQGSAQGAREMILYRANGTAAPTPISSTNLHMRIHSEGIGLGAGAHSRSARLYYPGFPVGIGGVGELHAAFLIESRTRGSVQCSAAGNPGPLRSG